VLDDAEIVQNLSGAIERLQHFCGDDLQTEAIKSSVLDSRLHRELNALQQFEQCDEIFVAVASCIGGGQTLNHAS
jgi:hypothetical protein